MALSPSLQQFKSSGVYRLEFDKSQIISIPSETIRLIIGFSKKGPFNTPVFCQDSVFFTTIFGKIDTALERKGSFFHRTALTCLSRGPVIVLNLLSIDITLDKSDFASISTSSTIANPVKVNAPITSYFNRDKFWFADADTFVSFANNGTSQSITNQRLLNLANTGRKPISVITKKTTALGFDILAKDWFGAGKVPDFMKDTDYIKDFMIDVVIVDGDFSSYDNLAIDPIFGDYFDSTGLKKNVTDAFGQIIDGLNAFLNLEQVTVLGVYTGTLIPEFQSKDGENLYIEDLVNLETSKTGLLLGFDQEELDDNPTLISGDKIDLVGSGLESEDPNTLDFLSYYGSIKSNLSFAGASGNTLEFVCSGTANGQTGQNALLIASTGIVAATGYQLGEYDTLRIYSPTYGVVGGETSAFANTSAYNTFLSDVAINQTYIEAGGTGAGTTGAANFVHVTSESAAADGTYVDLKISLTASTGVTGPTDITQSYYRIDGYGLTAVAGATFGLIKSQNFTFDYTGDIYAGNDSSLYTTNLSGILTDGDKVDISGSTSLAYAQFDRLSTNDYSITAFTNIFDGLTETYAPIFSKLTNYATVNAWTSSDFTGATAILNQNPFKFLTLTGDINENFELWAGVTYTNPVTSVYVDNSSSGPLGASGFNGEIKAGQYLVQNFGGTGTASAIDPETGKSRLTRIIRVFEDLDPTSSTYLKIKITTNDPIYIRTDAGSEIERYKEITDFVDHYRFHTLNGYSLRDAQMPNGTITRQNQILDVLDDTNIGSALADKEVIDFRYIVDTFEGGIEPSSKIRLTNLAKNRQSALAICNMPSVKQFKNSTNPLFKLDSSSTFNTQYIPSGGNLNLNPSNIFNLPGIADGANYSAFYGPNLILREAGRNYSIPPAGHVSNLYIDKYSLALPYSIVAGPRRGVITGEGLVGTEYNFDRVDLDNIEPFGYNAIVNKRGFGLVINANQTAQQNVKSALSQIHVRELLIYVQDGIEAILKNYRWEFNTAQNRLEIKTLADNFLTQVLSDGGVYDFQNIMDTTNNTPEVIDSNLGILDTYIEPVRGLGILVHRTTILKTGTISTGNFI